MTFKAFDSSSAIVFGGAGGLGEAAVRRLHGEGLGVLIADMARDKGAALAGELGRGTCFAQTDITDEDSVLASVEQAAALGTLRFAVIAHGGFGVAERIGGGGGRTAPTPEFRKSDEH